MINKLWNEGLGVSPGRTAERPIGPLAPDARFGSDVAADTLRALDIPYIALNPGASFRGLHDSLVNRLGNERPTMLLCLHEEHAVAIAHGWAKVTGRAMAAAGNSADYRKLVDIVAKSGGTLQERNILMGVDL